jgi:hypothetical protein
MLLIFLIFANLVHVKRKQCHHLIKTCKHVFEAGVLASCNLSCRPAVGL